MAAKKIYDLLYQDLRAPWPPLSSNTLIIWNLKKAPAPLCLETKNCWGRIAEVQSQIRTAKVTMLGTALCHSPQLPLCWFVIGGRQLHNTCMNAFNFARSKLNLSSRSAVPACGGCFVWIRVWYVCVLVNVCECGCVCAWLYIGKLLPKLFKQNFSVTRYIGWYDKERQYFWRWLIDSFQNLKQRNLYMMYWKELLIICPQAYLEFCS